MLLCTPLGGRDIIGGNWRALAVHYAAHGCWSAFSFLSRSLTGTEARGLATFQMAMAPLVRLMTSLPCVDGHVVRLKAQKPLGIMLWTVGLVVGVPWLVSYVFILGTSLGTGGSWSSLPPMVFLFWFGAWPILNLAKKRHFHYLAARRLRSDLRAVAPLGCRAVA